MSSGPEVDSYVVMWVRDTSGECSDEDKGNATITDGSTFYNITKLEEDSNYTITVMATNVAGSEISNPVTGMTGEAGEGLVTYDIKKTIIKLYFLPAPSDPPTSVTTSNVTSSSITVQWGPVNCIHRNGYITGYTMQYRVKGSDDTNNMRVTSSSTEATISGLDFATNYSIEVAAVNSVEAGKYSVAIIGTTKGITFNYIFILLFFYYGSILIKILY